MHQVAPMPGELATDYSWQVDTTPLEMNSMLHACYCLQGNYTQNPLPLQGTATIRSCSNDMHNH